LIGAIWSRIFSETEPGFGFIDTKTPELSMSVLKEYRNNGIGTKLLNIMIDKLIQSDCEQVSLSVDKINYAIKMYKEFGFETVDSDEDSVIMIIKLK